MRAAGLLAAAAACALPSGAIAAQCYAACASDAECSNSSCAACWGGRCDPCQGKRCNATGASCPSACDCNQFAFCVLRPVPTPPPAPTPPPPPASPCKVTGCSCSKGIGNSGPNVGDVPVASVQECCNLCFATQGCAGWVFANGAPDPDPDQPGTCYIKSSWGGAVSDDHYISGQNTAAREK
eukprot:TRINITY_DN9046_c0_g1_i1.p2 TRINITY_DN9046_c0_g1~~TRINITY_DN9046_c0_g1_i1.p2  ORF type:complete len:207 (+),score=70.59 TRINITY_DN9046_c0_g1_i1:76-621(+)